MKTILKRLTICTILTFCLGCFMTTTRVEADFDGGLTGTSETNISFTPALNPGKDDTDEPNPNQPTEQPGTEDPNTQPNDDEEKPEGPDDQNVDHNQIVNPPSGLVAMGQNPIQSNQTTSSTLPQTSEKSSTNVVVAALVLILTGILIGSEMKLEAKK